MAYTILFFITICFAEVFGQYEIGFTQSGPFDEINYMLPSDCFSQNMNCSNPQGYILKKNVKFCEENINNSKNIGLFAVKYISHEICEQVI